MTTAEITELYDSSVSCEVTDRRSESFILHGSLLKQKLLEAGGCWELWLNHEQHSVHFLSGFVCITLVSPSPPSLLYVGPHLSLPQSFSTRSPSLMELAALISSCCILLEAEVFIVVWGRDQSLCLSLSTLTCVSVRAAQEFFSRLCFTSGWSWWFQKITNWRFLFLWPDSMFYSLNWAAVLCCSSNGILLWERCWVILFLQSGLLCMKQKAVITNPEMTVLVNQKEWIGKYPQAWIWLRHMCSVDFRWYWTGWVWPMGRFIKSVGLFICLSTHFIFNLCVHHIHSWSPSWHWGQTHNTASRTRASQQQSLSTCWHVTSSWCRGVCLTVASFSTTGTWAALTTSLTGERKHWQQKHRRLLQCC